MKINKFLVVILLIIAAGCQENFLDVTNPNRLTEDQFWKTEADAFKAITAAYAQITVPLWGRWGHYECKILVENYRTDLGVFKPDYDEWVEMYSFNMSSENYTKDYYWYYYYQGIYMCNLVLENIDECEMDATTRNQIKGEAKFLRAFYHLKLVSYFKNIPLITSVPQSPEDYYPFQSLPEAVYTQIEADFTEAKNLLPASWPSQYTGRATKGAASAYLGTTYLYQNKWSEASAEFQQVMGMGYGLEPSYWDLFNGAKENGIESIFEIQFTVDRPNNVSESHTMPAQIGSWEQGGPTDWFFGLLMTDRKADGGLSDRVYGTILFDDPNTESFLLEPGQTWGDVYGTTTFFKKWVHKSDAELAQEPSFSRSGINTIELRYADVLLMYAEAENELGNTPGAYDPINLVRARSGVTPLPANMTQAEMRDHIRNYERPAELAFEGKRWLDLVRWGNVKNTLTNHGNNWADQFDTGIDEFLPIPSIDIYNNPNVFQNEGF